MKSDVGVIELPTYGADNETRPKKHLNTTVKL